MRSAAMLAQSGASAGQAVVWIAVLIVVVIAAGIGVMVLRRRFPGSDRSPAGDPGSLLESLRAMRDSGEMSTDEFEQARAALLHKATGKPVTRKAGSGAKPPPVKSDSRSAEPGFDLAGDPLPKPDTSGDRDP